MFTSSDHTFALCAYKESSFLEECILSLKNQSIKSNIIIATSTPNEHISRLAEKYGLEVFVNTGVAGIAGDWNFALKCVNTPLVTIAHQDDIYEPLYLESILEGFNSAKNPIICFTHYAELRDGKKVYKNKLLNIKKLMLSPLKLFKNSIFVRRRVLSLGCPICCPSVSFVTDIIKSNPFESGFKSDLDWQKWEVLSKKKGAFIYISKPLMCHRIHEESATTEIIGDNLRTKEDFAMYCKFWPKWIARILAKAYSASEKSNDVK